jgi:methylmalonyl-CoA mutase, N-terminal domain
VTERDHRPRSTGEGPDPGRARWRETLRAKALGSAPERRERFETSSGIEVRDLYTAADPADFDEIRDLGRPGEYPFTRGVQPTMYRSRFWTMRQYAGFATAEETNRALPIPARAGSDRAVRRLRPADPDGVRLRCPGGRRRGGRVGVPIDSLADMEILLDGIPLGEVSTSMTINATAPILLALYVAAAEARASRAPDRRDDPERHPQGVHRPGHVHLPAAASMRLVTDVFEFCLAELPRWNTISISGYHMREAGATAAQELAFTLADAIAYCEAAVARGLDIDEFAPASPSSSPPGASCSRRSRSSGSRGGCGRRSSGSVSVHRTSVR